MKISPIPAILVALVLLSGLAACGPSASGTPAATELPGQTSAPVGLTETPAATQPPTQAPTEASGGGTGGQCANPMYPVIGGASWTYAGSNATTGTFSFTRTYPEIRDDGFTDQDAWTNGLTRTGQWSCDSGNLKALSLGTGAGTVSSGDPNFVANSTTSEGVTIPAGMNVGDTWTQTIRIEGDLTMADGTTAGATNEATMNCSALAQESVTVPAGTFDAMKVECQVAMTITVTMEGLSIPPTAINSTSDAWYAPNVGWVKSVESSGVGSNTIELQSYSLP